jgi:SpoVK/Ycf46/Vps4 family AAA+-type ATPase
MSAIRRNGDKVILSDFEYAFTRVKPSISPEITEQYEQFQQMHNRM